EREAIRMGRLVEDLLELARLDEPRPVAHAPVDLLPIAQDAALDASASAPGRRIFVVVPEGVDSSEGGDDAPPADAAPDSAPATPAATTLTGPIAFAGSALARLRRRRPAVEASAATTAPGPAQLPEVGPIVRGDEDKLRQVITNLLG